MFDLGLGFDEIIVLALIAIIFVGPKDLPNLFYTAGKFLGRIRDMASEFKYSMEDIAHEQQIEQEKKKILQSMESIDNNINQELPEKKSDITELNQVHDDKK